jgi:ABC-2 type transport system permease protein
MNKLKNSLRIIGALAAKDISAALKNKNTLSNIIVVLLTVVFYKYLPTIFSDELPSLLVYDAGSSELIAGMEYNASFEAYIYDSQAVMEDQLVGGDIPELGLVVPADFDSLVEEGAVVELNGYFNHWISDAEADELVQLFETELGQTVGRTVQLDVMRNNVYPSEDSWGISVTASIAVLLAVTIVGITTIPHLMIEEKESKTLDALMVSPATPGQVVAGKAVAGLLYSLLGAAVALALNARVFNHWGIAILGVVSVSLFSAALGILLGTLLEVKQQIITWGFLLMNILLVPAFLSIMSDLLPPAVITAVSVIPTVMAARVIRISAWNHAPLGSFLPQIGFILAWTTALLLVEVWVLRRKDK